jgi:hypothetical protein
MQPAGSTSCNHNSSVMYNPCRRQKLQTSPAPSCMYALMRVDVCSVWNTRPCALHVTAQHTCCACNVSRASCSAASLPCRSSLSAASCVLAASRSAALCSASAALVDAALQFGQHRTVETDIRCKVCRILHTRQRQASKRLHANSTECCVDTASTCKATCSSAEPGNMVVMSQTTGGECSSCTHSSAVCSSAARESREAWRPCRLV